MIGIIIIYRMETNTQSTRDFVKSMLKLRSTVDNSTALQALQLAPIGSTEPQSRENPQVVSRRKRLKLGPSRGNTLLQRQQTNNAGGDTSLNSDLSNVFTRESPGKKLTIELKMQKAEQCEESSPPSVRNVGNGIFTDRFEDVKEGRDQLGNNGYTLISKLLSHTSNQSAGKLIQLRKPPGLLPTIHSKSTHDIDAQRMLIKQKILCLEQTQNPRAKQQPMSDADREYEQMLKVRSMRQHQERIRQANLKCRYLLNKTIQQPMPFKESQQTKPMSQSPQPFKIRHSSPSPIQELPREIPDRTLVLSEVKKLSQRERIGKVRNADYGDSLDRLRKKYNFYEPGERVHQRYTLEKHTSSFVTSSNGCKLELCRETPELKPLPTHEVIHNELRQMRSNQITVRDSNNEYLFIDDEQFREKMEQNKGRLRAKLRELTQARQVYMDLLNFKK
ncbi:hypothetical protein FGO68_gene13887 [Halteria grandinella]|uniref:Uncharacterized protein n=1 Tax=Halteria grandinella TaxID=5974 RepID=A0A8J8NQE2_HALGN|nr:hypothetical protein FGO68_gene13887 [Halteria grandinella]